MEEFVFAIAERAFGTTIAVAIAIVLFALWITYYVTKRVTEIRADHNEIHKGLDKAEKNVDLIRADLSEIKGSMKIQEKTIGELKENAKAQWKSIERLEDSAERQWDSIQKMADSMNGFADNLVKLSGALVVLKENFEAIKNGTYIQSHSPVSLTDEGKKVAEEMGADAIIDKNWGVISEVLKEVDGKNAYDVQQFCINTAEERPERFFDPATIDKVKMFAFQKGKHVILFYSVLGLLIRDRYFSEHGTPLSRADD